MGTTGIIFGAIIAAWLVYLVPTIVRRNQQTSPVVDPSERFSDVQIISDAPPDSLDDEDSAVDVSTPLTRRAAVTEIARADARAAGRRRNSLIVLTLFLVTMVVLAVLDRVAWWTPAIPVVSIVAFLVVARFSVRAMHRQFDARLAEIAAGDEESTVRISREELARGSAQPQDSAVTTVAVGAPTGSTSGLLEPLPITRPTYVQSPVAPRTVRTIDLSAPLSAGEPVVAERDEQGSTAESSVQRAAGPQRADHPRRRASGE